MIANVADRQHAFVSKSISNVLKICLTTGNSNVCEGVIYLTVIPNCVLITGNEMQHILLIFDGTCSDIVQ